jgi:hypothetical protein
MARATPGHDEKRHRRDACATFFLGGEIDAIQVERLNDVA